MNPSVTDMTQTVYHEPLSDVYDTDSYNEPLSDPVYNEPISDVYDPDSVARTTR